MNNNFSFVLGTALLHFDQVVVYEFIVLEAKDLFEENFGLVGYLGVAWRRCVLHVERTRAFGGRAHATAVVVGA